jgi:uncharacterized protein with FMN-binding domain
MSSKTKIVVLKAKELIYTGIFIVLGILLICLLIYMFSDQNKDKTAAALSDSAVAKDATPETDVETEAVADVSDSPVYTPGVYTTVMALGGYELSVSVTVDADRITHVDITNLDDTVTAMYPLLPTALDSVNSQLSGVQSIDEITYSEDQAYTTILICDAIKRALE